MYHTLTDERRVEMERAALATLEEQLHEARINEAFLGPLEVFDNGERISERIERLEQQIERLVSAFPDLMASEEAVA